MHAILARNLVPTPPVSDLFGVTGRHWLARQDLPADERAAVQALLRQLGFHAGDLAAVSYLGLNPTVRQSGKSPASHGHISKAGRSQVRGVLVEAAWSACRTPGSLRAFYQRIWRAGVGSRLAKLSRSARRTRRGGSERGSRWPRKTAPPHLPIPSRAPG